MNLRPDQIFKRLNSNNWKKRAAAIEALKTLSTAQDWIRFIDHTESQSIVIQQMILEPLCYFIKNSPARESMRSIQLIYASQSPYLLNEKMNARTLESFVQSPYIEYSLKVNTLEQLLKEYIREPMFPTTGLTLLIRAIGQIQSRKSVPLLGRYIKDSRESVIYEIIRAFHSIGSSKARPFLYRLLSKENRLLANAAIEALGQHSFTELDYYSIYKMFRFGRPTERSNLVHLTRHFPKPVAIAFLFYWFRVARNKEVSLAILQRCSKISTPMVTKFLFRVAARNPDPTIRFFANGAVNYHSKKCLAIAIEQTLRINWSEAKQLAMYKMRSLPYPLAKRLLNRLRKKFNRFNQQEKISAIHAIFYFEESSEHLAWAYESIKKDKTLLYTLVLNTMNWSMPPVQSLFPKVAQHGGVVETTLIKKLISIGRADLLGSHISIFKKLLERNDFNQRLIAAQSLLISKDPDASRATWMANINWLEKEQMHLVHSVSRFITDQTIRPQKLIAWTDCKEHFEIIKKVLNELDTTLWKIEDWRKLLAISTLAFSKSLHDQILDILIEFCKAQESFWQDFITPLIQSTYDINQLANILLIADAQRDKIKLDAEYHLFYGIQGEEYVPSEFIIQFLSRTHHQEIYQVLISWMLTLDHNRRKKVLPILRQPVFRLSPEVTLG